MAKKMYVAGNKKDKKVVEKSGVYLSGFPKHDTIKKNIKKKKNIKELDIDIFEIDNEETIDKVFKGKKFNLQWQNEKITNIVFEDESIEKVLYFSVNKNTVIRNGKDKISMSISVFEPDGITPDTKFKGDLLIPVNVPYGDRVVYVMGNLEHGVLVRDFIPDALGKYVYPAEGLKISGFRIEKHIYINSIHKISKNIEVYK